MHIKSIHILYIIQSKGPASGRHMLHLYNQLYNIPYTIQFLTVIGEKYNHGLILHNRD